MPEFSSEKKKSNFERRKRKKRRPFSEYDIGHERRRRRGKRGVSEKFALLLLRIE